MAFSEEKGGISVWTAIACFLIICIIGFVSRWYTSRRLNDIDGVADICISKNEEEAECLINLDENFPK